MNDFDNAIILTDENGKEIPFEFLDFVNYEGKEYVVLLPLDPKEYGGMAVILRVEESTEDDVMNYVGVEDENTVNTVFEIFKKKFKNEFNFVD